MVLDVWATIDGMVHLAAGRLTAARAAVESLPPPEQTGATELDMVRMVILAQVAISTDDRNLLQQMVAHAHDAYSSGASMVRRTAAYVLALAAWHRNDLHDAMRWFGDDINLFGTPLTPQALDQVILSARIASAAGDAGCRARVLRAMQKLRARRARDPAVRRGRRICRAEYSKAMPTRWSWPRTYSRRPRDRCYTPRRPKMPAAQLALADRKDEALEQLNAAFDTYTRLGALADARRVGRELRRLGVERRIVSQPRAKTGWDSLTDSELKVVNLIARGATNRATADQLHLSLHTVKTHVHNAFGKLDISSRAQLAQVMR